MIKYFIKITDCECVKICSCDGTYYALIKKIKIVENVLQNRYKGGNKSFLYKCKILENTEIIDIKNLQSVCFQIEFTNNSSEMYLAEPVNSIEKE